MWNFSLISKVKKDMLREVDSLTCPFILSPYILKSFHSFLVYPSYFFLQKHLGYMHVFLYSLISYIKDKLYMLFHSLPFSLKSISWELLPLSSRISFFFSQLSSIPLYVYTQFSQPITCIGALK